MIVGCWASKGGGSDGRDFLGGEVVVFEVREFPITWNDDFGFDCVRCGRKTRVWSDDEQVCGCRNAAANRILERMFAHWVNNTVSRQLNWPITPASKRD